MAQDVLLEVFNEQLTMWNTAKNKALERGDSEVCRIAVRHITDLVLQGAPLGYNIVEVDGETFFARSPVQERG